MLDDFKYRRKLNTLFAKQKKQKQFYDEYIEKARKEGKDKEEIEMLQAEASHEYFELQDKIRLLTSTHLFQKAHKLIVQSPDHRDEELWTRSLTSYGRLILTEKGINELRERIHAEQKRRRDAFLPWLGALTGIIAALTGLFAV